MNRPQRICLVALSNLLTMSCVGCSRKQAPETNKQPEHQPMRTVVELRDSRIKALGQELSAETDDMFHQLGVVVDQNFRPRIVGGFKAPQGLLPWQVAILLRPYNNLQFCGGSIIASRWVLTAAHCIESPATSKPANLVVYANSVSLNSGGLQVSVNRIIGHPARKPGTNDNDLALLELAAPVQNSDIVQLVSPSDEETLAAPGHEGLVSGWGAIAENGPSSNDLLYVDLPFVSRETCNSPESYNGAITNNMICAGSQARDSCQGDSGGPLVVPFGQEGLGKPAKLVGIVSFGEGCAREKKYGVYTRVANYLGWIRANAR